MSTRPTLVNATPEQRRVDSPALDRARTQVLGAFKGLEDLLLAARASEDQQRAVVDLVAEALTAKARSLTPDEQLVADGLLDVPHAAEFLGVGQTLVRSLLETGALRFCKVGARTLIPRRMLVEYAAAQLTERRGGGR